MYQYLLICVVVAQVRYPLISTSMSIDILWSLSPEESQPSQSMRLYLRVRNMLLPAAARVHSNLLLALVLVSYALGCTALMHCYRRLLLLLLLLSVCVAVALTICASSELIAITCPWSRNGMTSLQSPHAII